MKKHLLSLAAGLLVFGAISLGSNDTVFAADTIADGVYIGTVNVGGMNEEEASAAISEYVQSIQETTFTLVGSSGSIEVTAEDMGVTASVDATIKQALGVTHTGSLITRYKDVEDLAKAGKKLPLTLEVDKQKTAQLLYDKRDKLGVEAQDATLKHEDGAFTYVAGTAGSEVNEEESVYVINDFLANEYDGTNNEITLVSEDVEPKGSEEELSQIKDLLASFSTDYSSSAAGRKANLANACSKISGTVLYPGEEFSVYSAITPITLENGYEVAGAYVNGTTVDSVGGGVCQVATTLYNAVIRAELNVTKRYNHSMLVSYVPASDDAAIAGTWKDLRFENNTDYPIYIEGSTDGSTISFRIYGVETRDSSRKVSFESVIVEQDEPTYQWNKDASQPAGYWHTEQSAHRRTVAQLWKVVTVNGVEESRELFNSSSYIASPKIVTIGIAGASAEAIAALDAAIATNDEATIRAAASNLGSGGTVSQETPATETPAADTPAVETPAETPSTSSETTGSSSTDNSSTNSSNGTSSGNTTSGSSTGTGTGASQTTTGGEGAN